MSESSESSGGTPTSGGVLIIDFGAQYCQLIARRIREFGVYSRITVPDRAAMMFSAMKPDAIVLSGGPNSVYDESAPVLDKDILQAGVPVLGICYGLQWLTQALGGKVAPGRKAESTTHRNRADAGRPSPRGGVDEEHGVDVAW